MPTIDLTDDELAAVTAAIRRTIEDDRFPHAPRLDPLHAALGKFEAATATDTDNRIKAETAPKPTPQPKAPPPAKANKRAWRRAAWLLATPKGKRPGSTGVGRASLQKPLGFRVLLPRSRICKRDATSD